MSYEDYTWERYYEDIYHRQKKVNNALAVELGETESKTAELEFALNRVISSPFWKALAPARKIYGRLSGSHSEGGSKSPEKGGNGGAGGASAVSSGERGAAAGRTPASTQSAADSEYQRRLAMYEDFYGQWIRKDPFEQKYSQYDFFKPECGGADILNRTENSTESGIDLGKSMENATGEGINHRSGLKFEYIYIEDCIGKINVDNFDFDKKAKNAQNTAIWLIFTGKNGCLARGFEERLNDALKGSTNAQIAYADEDSMCFLSGKGQYRRFHPNMKPGWSPDTLDSFFYFGHIAAIRADLAAKLNWLGSDNCWKNVYDLFLQAAEHVGTQWNTDEVIHIPQILFHNYIEESACTDQLRMGLRSKDITKDRPGDVIGAGPEFNDIKMAAFERRSISGRIISGKNHRLFSGQDRGHYHIFYDLPDDTLISVLILSKDHPEVLKTCLSSFIERTDYKNLEFIIVDNGSSEENKAIYQEEIEELVGAYPHKYIYRPMDFNFSRMCNIAAKEANGKLLLFLNDDIEIIQKDWLRLMAGYALLPHIGAVGAKLLYAGTDQIQHIGISNLDIGPSHKLVIYPDDRSYYFGKNMLEHDMIGVTGACLMVDKIKFKQIQGFNEDFAVAYNDVDLCMKLCESGFTNLQCNGALLYHYESMTRGQDAGNDDKWERLLQEKDRLYKLHPQFKSHDPYYNDNLIGNHSNYLCNYDFGYNNHLKTEVVRQLDAGNLAEIDGTSYRFSMDFAGIQAKHNLEEPEITELRGWCFKAGEDNSELKVRLLLKKEAEAAKNEPDGSKNCLFELDTDPMPRDDLEDVFRNETNIRLCGFVGKFMKNDLKSGHYRVGIIPYLSNDDLTNENKTNNVIFTDTILKI